MARVIAVFFVVAAHTCAVLALPPCACTRNLRPVCGSDGTTYNNQCLLDCQRTKTNHNLFTAREGSCDEQDTVKVVEPNLPTCACTREMKPVCGSDGTTYSNACLLNCATAKNHLLSIKHAGPCGEPVKVVDDNSSAGHGCTCTRNYEPVCGTNGVTYPNTCMLNCAGATLDRYAPCEIQGY